ncbi:hypothetical protein D9M72_327600 [compost metagenome]
MDGRVVHDHRGIEVAAFDLRDERVRLARDHVQIDRRMAAFELQRGAHELPQPRHDGAELHGAGQRRVGLRAVPRLLVQRDDLRGHRHQRTPLLVERDQLAAPREERALEVAFEGAHLQADGRLRERNALRGGGERAFGGHGEEGAKHAQAGHDEKAFLSS